MKLSRAEAAVLALTLIFVAAVAVSSLVSPSAGADAHIRPGSRAEKHELFTGGDSAAADISVTPGPDADLVNINTADADELASLSGIGSSLAGRIIAYRDENGGFAEKADIMNVPGIGEGIFSEIEDHITV